MIKFLRYSVITNILALIILFFLQLLDIYKKDFIFLTYIIIFLVMASIIGIMILEYRANDDILSKGIPSQARINTIEKTSVTLNDSIQLKLNITVTPINQDKYDTQVLKFVNKEKFNKIRVGDIIQICYSIENKFCVSIQNFD